MLVTIIGAGTSGLIGGALLSQFGFEVNIYEQNSEVGGRARCEEIEGFLVDYGLHLVRNGEKGFIAKTFEELKQPLKIIPLPEPELLFYEKGEFVEYPVGQKFLLSDIVEDKDKDLMLEIVRNPNIVEENFDKPILNWIEEKKGSEKLKKYLTFAALGLVCPFIEEASAGELFDLIKRRMSLKNSKTGGVVGGFGTIHKNLVKIINEKGGEIHTGCKVKKIIVEKEKAKAIIIDKKIPADIIICAVPPKMVHKLLDENSVNNEKNNFLKNLKPTCGVSIDYGLKEKITDINALIMSIEDIHLLGIATSNLDLSLAPKYKQLLTFCAITKREDIENKEKQDTILRLLESKVREMFPKIENYIEWKRPLILPMINGVELNIYQHRKRRPNPSFLGIENLFLSGDYLGAESAGGDIAVTSARMCVEKIKEIYS